MAKQRKMVIKGVGAFLAKRYNRDLNGEEVITLGRLQDLNITLNTELEDIFGGDALFAFDTLVTEKSIEITATDAEFDLDTVRLMLGDSGDVLDDDKFINILNERARSKAGMNGTATVGVMAPRYSDSLFKGEKDCQVSLRRNDSNLLLKQVDFIEDAVPDENEFMVDFDNKQVIVSEDKIGMSFVMNYRKAEDSVDVYSILVDEVPFNVHVIHTGVFLQKDNTRAGVETELYQCRASGEFTIGAERNTASTSTITLRVLDPERDDGRLGTIKRFKLSQEQMSGYDNGEE